jgi:hypothetical protein
MCGAVGDAAVFRRPNEALLDGLESRTSLTAGNTAWFGQPRNHLRVYDEACRPTCVRSTGQRVVSIAAGVEAISSSASILDTMSRLSCAAIAPTNAESGTGGL